MPTIVDLFAGAGGVSCAARDTCLGGRHVELCPSACATLRAAGFADVAECDVRDLATWVPTWPVTLLHASHPCPKWSVANVREGRREAAVDGWPWVLDAIDAVRPELVTIENVKDAPVLGWARDLRKRGYRAAIWRLDAMNYGAPQTRTRMIVCASHYDLPVMPPLRTGLGFCRIERWAACSAPTMAS